MWPTWSLVSWRGTAFAWSLIRWGQLPSFEELCLVGKVGPACHNTTCCPVLQTCSLMSWLGGPLAVLIG